MCDRAVLSHLEVLGHELAILLLLKLSDVVSCRAGALKVGGKEQLLLALPDVDLRDQVRRARSKGVKTEFSGGRLGL